VSVAVSALAVTVVSGVYNASVQRGAARDARRQGAANAASILGMARRNNELSLTAADFNADTTMMIAGANAGAIRRNAQRNAELLTIEYVEEIRRHVRGEKQLAGSIRSGAAATGFAVNQGTPLLFLSNELDEAETERNFIKDRGVMTVFNYLAQENDRANVIMMTGSLNAAAIRFNAGIEAEIYLNEQTGAADATRSRGNSAAKQLNAQSYGTILSTIGSAASQGASIYGNYKADIANTGYTTSGAGGGD